MERQNSGQPQKQLSKEFVRQWLIENNFQGKDGQTIPEMNKELIDSITNRYIELYERISGENFEKGNADQIVDRIERNVNNFLSTLV